MGDVGVRVRLLGGLEVEGVDSMALGSRKGRTLFKRLALAAGRPVATDVLIDTIWPAGDAPARPAEQVSVLVSRLRRALGAERVVYRDGGYVLVSDWLDVSALADLVIEAERRLADGLYAAALAAADAAQRLARGPLLADEPDADWVDTERAATDRLVSRARLLTAEAALAAGRPADAAEAARRALDADPYDEVALRLLMRSTAAAGRPAVGIAAYADTAARVAEDLGVDLSAATQELHLALLRGAGPDAAAPAEVGLAPRDDALPGRASELAALRAAFEVAAGGTAGVVSVEGEAGIGKTRLIETFLGGLQSDRVEVLRATADRNGVLPLGPVLDALGRRLLVAGPDERATLLGPEADILEPLLRPGAATSAAYRDLLTAQEPGASAGGAVLHLAVLAVVARLAERAPVVLVVDDAQWADTSTIAWLGLVGSRAAGLAVLAVIARRHDVGTVPSGATRIELGRLDRMAAAAVVGADRVDDIYERSGGHPLFLVELARAKTDRLPDSIRQAVVERLGDSPVVATLRAAAELGPAVDVDLLAGVLGRNPMELLDDLDEGQRRFVLADAPTGYVFRHEIVREALAADTPTARRAFLHREAARILAARPMTEPLTVATHARLGGDTALAAQAFADAAEVAGARYDHEEVLRLTARSIELAPSGRAYLIRGRSLVLLRRYDEARAAAAAARDLGVGAEALEVAASAAYYARDLDEVLRLADEAVATTADQEILDQCRYLAVKVEHTLGHVGAVERRLADSEPTGGSRTAPFLRAWLALVHLHRGHVDAASIDLRHSEAARRAPVPYAPLYMDQFAAQHAGLAGRPVEALAIAARLAAEVERQQAFRFVGRAEVYRGWALALLCAPEAEDAIESARAASDAAGNPEPYGQATLDLATLRLDLGDTGTAARLLAEAAEVTRAGRQVSNAWRIDLRRRYLEGRLAVAQEAPAAAVEAAADVVARCSAEPMERYLVLGRLLEIEARVLAGDDSDPVEVRRLLDAAERVARPELWRTTARLAVRLDSAELRSRASAYVEELAAAAGEHADRLRAAATAY